MPKSFLSLAVVTTLGLLAVGCAKPQQKLSRGVTDVTEFVRLGEMRRTIEQEGLWNGSNASWTSGVIEGFNKSLVRTAVGAVEIVTFPLPPYDPLFPNYLGPAPVYPASFKPGHLSASVFDTDNYLGFSGGDIAPMIPGSRFRIQPF